MVNQSFSGRVDYDTQTDEQGRFVFERVTPGAIIGLSLRRYAGPSRLDSLEPRHRGGETRPDAPRPGRRHWPAGCRPPPGSPGFLAGRSRRSDSGSLDDRREPDPRQPDDYPDFTSEQQVRLVRALLQDRRGQGILQGERQVRRRPPCRRLVPHRGRPRRAGTCSNSTSAGDTSRTREGSVRCPLPRSPCPRSPVAGAMSRWTWGRSGWRSSASASSRSVTRLRPSPEISPMAGRSTWEPSRQVRAPAFLGDLPAA